MNRERSEIQNALFRFFRAFRGSFIARIKTAAMRTRTAAGV
jgi:hypothetical protein